MHFPIKWGEEEAAEGRKTAAAADLMFAIFPENCSPFSRLPVFSFFPTRGKNSGNITFFVRFFGNILTKNKENT